MLLNKKQIAYFFILLQIFCHRFLIDQKYVNVCRQTFRTSRVHKMFDCSTELVLTYLHIVQTLVFDFALSFTRNLIIMRCATGT